MIAIVTPFRVTGFTEAFHPTKKPAITESKFYPVYLVLDEEDAAYVQIRDDNGVPCWKRLADCLIVED